MKQMNELQELSLEIVKPLLKLGRSIVHNRATIARAVTTYLIYICQAAYWMHHNFGVNSAPQNFASFIETPF